MILVIKRLFGFAKVRSRGLAKNTHWLVITCGLTNLSLARRRLMAGTEGTCAGRWAMGHRTVDVPHHSPSEQRMPTEFTLVTNPGTDFRVET